MPIHEKVALVTGGSSGIGMATAVAFAKEGTTVVIASRQRTAADNTRQAFRRAGGEGLWIEADASQAVQVQALAKRTAATHGRLDYAFNNAGGGVKSGRTVEIDEEDWHQTINGYLKSVWLCLKYEIREMLKLVNRSWIVVMRHDTAGDGHHRPAR